MRNLFLFCVAIATIIFCVTSFAADSTLDKPKAKAVDPVDPADLSGLWEAHGVAYDADEAGAPYASLVIFKKINDGYVVQFTGGPGNNIVGIAVREGEVVSIAWSGSVNRTGISLYKMGGGDGGKAMTGKWMALPRCTWENETMKYIGPAPAAKKKAGDT